MSTLDQRCPHCGALLRGDGSWCTLCNTDLRPAPVPEPVHVPDLPAPAAYQPPATPPPLSLDPALDPLTAPLEQVIASALAEQELEQAALEAAAAAAARGESAPVDPVTGRPAEDAWDRTDPTAGLADTDVMFALLRGETQDPWLARFNGAFDEPSTRIAFIVGGAGALTLVLFTGFYLVGLLLR